MEPSGTQPVDLRTTSETCSTRRVTAHTPALSLLCPHIAPAFKFHAQAPGLCGLFPYQHHPAARRGRQVPRPARARPGSALREAPAQGKDLSTGTVGNSSHKVARMYRPSFTYFQLSLACTPNGLRHCLHDARSCPYERRVCCQDRMTGPQGGTTDNAAHCGKLTRMSSGAVDYPQAYESTHPAEENKLYK